MKTERVSFRSEQGVMDKVADICDGHGLSKSEVLRFALDHGVSELARELERYDELNAESIMKAMWLGIDISELDSIRRV